MRAPTLRAPVASALTGLLLVQRPEFATDRAGVWLALASAAGTAVGMIGLNRLGGLDARSVVTHFSGVSAAFALAALLLVTGPSAWLILYNPLRRGGTPIHTTT